MKERSLIFGLLFVALPVYAAVNTLQGYDDDWGKLLDAGADQTITLPSTADLDGIVLSAGFSEGLGSDLGWVQVREPGIVSFGDDSSPNTTATFPVPGRYVLRFWASGADETVGDDVSVKVTAAPVTNEAVVVNDATITNDALVVYVATNGSDVNPGTKELPYRTIGKALENVRAGDVVAVRAGIYDESVHSSVHAVPGGTSFSDAVTIRSHPGEEVILQPSNAVNVITLNTPVRYTIWEDLILDGGRNPHSEAGGIYLGGGANHNRFENIEIRNMLRHGILTAGEDTSFNEFVDLNVHHNGSRSNLDHGIYIGTSDNVIDGGEYHDNSSYGVHLYNDPPEDVDRNVVRNVRSYNNRKGMALGSGDGNIAYNNLIYDNWESGASIGYGASNTKFYNNTVVGTENDYAVTVLNTATNADVRNNIFWENGANAVRDLGAGTVNVSNLALNPLFVNDSEKNFRLSPGSPAIDTGTPVAEAVRVDMDGVVRPVGAGFDIGAHEYR